MNRVWSSAKKKTTLKTFLTSSLTHFEVKLPESSLNSFQMRCHNPSSVVSLTWSSQPGQKLNCVAQSCQEAWKLGDKMGRRVAEEKENIQE